MSGGGQAELSRGRAVQEPGCEHALVDQAAGAAVPTPSASNARERSPSGRSGSSTMVTPAAKTAWPSLSFRKVVPRATVGPLIALVRWRTMLPATRGSNTIGTALLCVLRGLRRAAARAAALRPISAGSGRSRARTTVRYS